VRALARDEGLKAWKEGDVFGVGHGVEASISVVSRSSGRGISCCAFGLSVADHGFLRFKDLLSDLSSFIALLAFLLSPTRFGFFAASVATASTQ
jgi:hypothetical protein